jgi:hypothetical protein
MIAVLIFLGLNLADAYISKVGLTLGATEANPSWLAQTFGANLAVRAVYALVVLAFLYYRGREDSLWGLNLLVFGVVIWDFLMVTAIFMASRF